MKRLSVFIKWGVRNFLQTRLSLEIDEQNEQTNQVVRNNLRQQVFRVVEFRICERIRFFFRNNKNIVTDDIKKCVLRSLG